MDTSVVREGRGLRMEFGGLFIIIELGRGLVVA